MPPARSAIATETLLAEPVGQAAHGNGMQAFDNRVALAFHLPQHQLETVASQRAALQLAIVPSRSQHMHLVRFQQCQVGRDALG